MADALRRSLPGTHTTDRPRSLRRAVAAAAVALGVGAGVLTAGPAVGAASAAPAFPPPTVTLPSGIENVVYAGQDSCDPRPKAGVQKFAALLRKVYPQFATGVNRVCEQGGISEHKEGRAIDWMVGYHNYAPAQALIGWLNAADTAGHPHAMASRLGIMYLIWNDRWMTFYGSQAGKWQPYSTSSPCPNGDRTGCHEDHVHLSFTWAGAYGRTSYWTGKVARDDYGPCRPAGMSWAPQYTTFNPTPCPYAAPPAPVASSPAYLKGLRQWSGVRLDTTWISPAVVPVQQRLGVAATGDFDAATQAALEAFQRSHGLPATGVTDVPTWRALLTAPSAPTAPSGDSSPSISAPVLSGPNVFGRSGSGAVVRYTRSGSALSATAENLGGTTKSNPAATPYDGGTAVAIRGANNAVYVKTGNSGHWSSWRGIGGRTWWAPALTTDGSGRLHVFFTGTTDHAVWTRTLDAGRWSRWTRVGGTSAAPPAATRLGAGVDLVIVDTGGVVRGNVLSDSGWAGWRGLSGRARSGVAVAYDPASGSRLYAIRGLNNHVYVRTLTTGWRYIGGTTRANPSVAVAGRKSFTVAITDNGNAYSSRTGFVSWSGWQRG